MEQNKKPLDINTVILAVNLAFVLFIMILNGLYIRYGAFSVKVVTSLAFAIMGGVNLLYLILTKHDSFKFPAVMVAGLFLAMLGDVILEIHFIAGAVLFALGHVLFLVSYCFLRKFNFVDFLCGAFIAFLAVLFITLAPIFDFSDDIAMEIVCIVYAIVISMMVGKAICNFAADCSWLTFIIMIGSLLFFFSDLMLLLNVFSSIQKYVGSLCLATYYPAECLLAFSVYLAKRDAELRMQN
ncbi:MAG: lysoplasmalogenase [Clostridiales bacterium]|nr:lysoplasmalogenase [Clostridiales bacterium]